jgi:DNA-3-methyladenine glycosylase
VTDLGPLLDREFFDRPVLEVAPDLLGRIVEHCAVDSDEAPVAVRLTEVEAYDGQDDPGSHAFRGRTPRNAVMFGPPGHVYVYFTYGMHWCMNVVCGEAGRAAAVLLRAGVVIAGESLAQTRRPSARRPAELARGPARLTTALGVSGSDNGADGCAPDSSLRLFAGAPIPRTQVCTGPRTGVNGGADFPWRFWIANEPSVSPYRPHMPRRRGLSP